MDMLACPQCGSEWFVSTRTGERIVFKMDENRRPVIAEPEPLSDAAVPTNQEHIYCGACSWQGASSELVESR